MTEPTLLSLIRQVRAQRSSQPDALEGERLRLEGSLIEFVEEAWPFIDAAPYQPNWAIDALCEHLQAVTDGRISRLLINFPPRCGKTIITSVCWIAWTWARRERTFRSGPQVRFLTGSYSHTLALGNANLTRRLILSPFYQRLWGSRYTFRDDQNTKVQVDNSEGGSRLATSVGGTLLGIGGDVLVVDDPHNVAQAESEAERETVSNWWSELSTTRLNDPKQSAIVVIMQRLHEADVSGTILSGDEDWCHLMIPMEYDWRRHCSTLLGWNDPRGLDDDGIPLVESGLPRDAEAAAELDDRNGELMWPERFGAKEVEAIKTGLGPYMASGRLQQLPQPKGGGIFKSEWWQVWEGTHFPIIDLVIASLDSAFTEKQENDPSALTVWGTFKHPETGKTRVILIDAWRKHLQMHGSATPRLEHEIPQLGDDAKIRRYKDTLWAERELPEVDSALTTARLKLVEAQAAKACEERKAAIKQLQQRSKEYRELGPFLDRATDNLRRGLIALKQNASVVGRDFRHVQTLHRVLSVALFDTPFRDTFGIPDSNDRRTFATFAGVVNGWCDSNDASLRHELQALDGAEQKEEAA